MFYHIYIISNVLFIVSYYIISNVLFIVSYYIISNVLFIVSYYIIQLLHSQMETEINKMRTENKIKERENEMIREELNKLKLECTSLQEALITTEGMSVC